MNSDIGNLPRAWGAPLFKAVQKQTAADFRVDEQLAVSFSGDGEHLYLQLEKTAMNTDEVVSLLQQIYNVQSADIGLCGLKDRHAITTQWFSVKTPLSAEPFEDAAATFNEQQHVQWQSTGGYIKQLRMISQVRHLRKLRRGAHSGNRFRIVLQEVLVEDPANNSVLVDNVSQRLSLINDKGFPAYIGAQRFGQADKTCSVPGNGLLDRASALPDNNAVCICQSLAVIYSTRCSPLGCVMVTGISCYPVSL